MVSFKNVLLFATLAFSTVLQVRDVNTILTNLKKIDADAKNVTTRTKAWDGTAVGGIYIIRDLQTLDNDTKAATSELASESQLTSTNSRTVVNYVTGTLSPDLKTALATIVSRRADWYKTGEQNILRQQLQTDKKDIDSLFVALIAKLSADTKTSGSSAQTTIDGYFNSAISTFT